MKYILIISFCLLFSCQNNENNKSAIKLKHFTPKTYHTDKNNPIEYNRVIEYLKLMEGFRATAYNDGGYSAIGYGQRHCYYEYAIRDTVSRMEAEYILKSSFNTHIVMVNTIYPELSYTQTLAVAHISYTIGIGEIIYKKLIVKNKLDTIKLNTYPYPEVRQFEIDLFYKQ